MNEAKIMVTPMHPSSSLDKDENGKTIYEKEYRGMIGSLLYLTAVNHILSLQLDYVHVFKHLLENLI